jgi:hypothetical protein
MVRLVRESPGRAVNRLAGCGVDRVYAGGHLGEQKSVVVGEEPGECLFQGARLCYGNDSGRWWAWLTICAAWG